MIKKKSMSNFFPPERVEIDSSELILKVYKPAFQSLLSRLLLKWLLTEKSPFL